MPLAIPIRKVDSLYHWGTLDPENVGKNGKSQEGNCLSASLCPNAWLSIARLGAEKLHVLQKTEGRFADVYAILDGEGYLPVKDYLLSVAEQQGFVEKRNLFEVDQYSDDELYGSTRYLTYDEAFIEANEEDDLIRSVEDYVGTSKLEAFIGIARSYSVLSGAEYGLVGALRYLASQGLKIDGIFNNSSYEPSNASAPVFAIFPGKVSGWSASPACNCPEDEVLLRKTGKIHKLGLEKPRIEQENGMSM